MSSYNPDWNEFRDKIIGLGEESSHKNYYPELQNKLAELQRFKDLLDFTNDAIIQAKGVDGIIIEVNKPALDIFHLSKDTLIEKSIFSFLSPKCSQKIIDALHNGDNNSPATFQCTLENTINVSVPIEITFQTTFLAGEPYIIIVLRDISERIQSEIKLKESEESIRTVFNSGFDAIFIHDDSGNILEVNIALEKLYKISKEEALKLNIKDFSSIENDLDDIPIIMHKAIKNGGSVFEWRAKRPLSGEIFDAEVALRKIVWFGKEALLAIIRDISDRKKNEKALQEKINILTQPLDDVSGIHFEDLFDLKTVQEIQDAFAEATGVASIITRPDGVPITKPSSFCDLCSNIRKTEKGFANCKHSDAIIGSQNIGKPIIQRCLSGGLWDGGASIEVGGKHIANWLIGQVRDESQTEENMRAYAREIGANEEDIIEAYRKVNSMSLEKFEKISKSLYLLANQLSISAYNNIQQARFIAERKQAEEERELLRGQLAQIQKMESIGRLAGGVAHDFNNMLGVIIGRVELALNKINDSNPINSELIEIRKAAERSADLTRQLLAFARKQNIAPKVLDLNETVESTLKMLRRLIGEDIHLAWLPGMNLNKIKIDPSQLDQILANLCVNARDAIANTGKITIETSKFVCDEHYCKEHSEAIPGDYIMLAVSDNGCGMSQETLSRLFEPFFTTKDVGKGTGLGLATVYGIVKQNNGFVNVYSEEGMGATFKIYLPSQASENLTANVKTIDSQSLNGSETILLVEDEPMILEMTQTILELHGYKVLTCASPFEAIKLAEKYDSNINLLITDIIMPDMNGRELSIKLLSIFPKMECLFMSGYTANVISQHGVLEEGLNFIQKPFSLKEIANKVREILNKK